MKRLVMMLVAFLLVGTGAMFAQEDTRAARKAAKEAEKAALCHFPECPVQAEFFGNRKIFVYGQGNCGGLYGVYREIRTDKAAEYVRRGNVSS